MKMVELDELNCKYKCSDYGKIPKKANKDVLSLASPHIESFNYFLEEGLQALLQSLPKLEFSIPSGDKILLALDQIEIGKPKIPSSLSKAVDLKLYPKECIEQGGTYKAPFHGVLSWLSNNCMKPPVPCEFGEIPIMVKSKGCNLYGMKPAELVRHGELVDDPGGYFIINGNCRVLRMLIANRRNYPIAMLRSSWKMRDINFSDKGILMRCVSKDQTSCINILHHLLTGGVKFEIQMDKQFFLIPLVMMLKALLNLSDRLIHYHLLKGREHDKYFSEKVKMMMRELQGKSLLDAEACRKYIGETFRAKLSHICPIWMDHEEVCRYILDTYVLTHLDTLKAKFDTLCMMTRKLFAFIGGECAAETVDVVSMQETSLGGHTYLQLVKQKLLDSLFGVKNYIILKSKQGGDNFKVTDALMRQAVRSCFKFSSVLKSFVGTGNLPQKTNCGLMQATGLSIWMEHLNRQRDLSHLRAIHRGGYFVEMKTIGPRRLTGEAWGFICPVHTPDGAPCGLLNHLAFNCFITNEIPDTFTIKTSLLKLGMSPLEMEPPRPHNQCLEVLLDGCLVGYSPKEDARPLEAQLRSLKVKQELYRYTEIVLVEQGEYNGPYPGLYIITSVARMMRPVINLTLGFVEYIGTFEQLYLNVAVSPEDIQEGVHTHMDIERTAMLSNIAKLVPFSDCNPNPRNMYQCQMAKQTMGTPLHNWQNQTSSKLYRLQYPQVPLVRNEHYDRIGMKDFCMGFNAVLAMVSYTGYDMEDAMIINKGAMERGLGHGQVYKSEFVDLGDVSTNMSRKRFKNSDEPTHIFKRQPNNSNLVDFLDDRGLPYPGAKLTDGDPYYCYHNLEKMSYNVVKYKGEDCVVDKCSIINMQSNYGDTLQRANITIRIRRDPIIGDKFASRSGQKGVLSRLYPTEDLPFSERGITPDIIFNPHGIPSRMTAGTLIDLVAGKCAAEFGKAFDSSPFEFDDKNPAFDYYGQILEKAGFNKYGEDILYSGTDGRMMEVEIFEGIIYYQRLRHMTADKWQVRSTGPIDSQTHQPVKGRKRGGAIRFGEMERDCLIAHGAAYMLKDRLLDCSDDSSEWVCAKCGSILTAITPDTLPHPNVRPQGCLVCGPDAEMRHIRMPYAFKFLVAELTSVGIRTDLGLKSAEQITRVPQVCVQEKQEESADSS